MNSEPKRRGRPPKKPIVTQIAVSAMPGLDRLYALRSDGKLYFCERVLIGRRQETSDWQEIAAPE
jgi:hypothetical protein